MLGPLERVLGGLAMDDALREPLDVAHRNALRLLRLVNTLLDFSRVEAGRMQARFEAVDLPALTVDLASTFRSACEAAGLTLSIDAPPLPEPVFVDRGMWETIVLNLLSNAFKFTWKGGIRVSLRQTADAAVVDVADTGIGIDERDQPRLFERFHRIEGAGGRTHEGSGIGLALVRELVRLHGGEVRVHSRPGLGTTFTVRLPLGSAHLPIDQIALVPTPERGGTAARAYVDEARRWLAAGDAPSRTPERIAGASVPGLVLVVDDNADMRDYVRELLIPRYDVAVAGNGAEALEAIARRRPDLVLSDVMMPGLDGFGLLKALRADPATAAIPVVLLSARAGHEATVEGLDAGADDYLVKPFTARELLARVSTHLETARLRRESADRQALLVAELQHRTRNLLGIVNAIVQQAMDRSADLPDFSRRFADRIDALARVQTLLSQSDQADAVAFDELIQSEVAALAGYADRVTLEGPTHVRLSPSIVQILALALHELATNAVKYGAFAHPDGHLTIRWHVDDDDGRTWLRMAWIERVPVGALPAASAHGTGQGRMLIEQALPYQLGAMTDFRLTPDGLLCTIALPLMSRGKLAG
ncbi:ATP-binding protein [Luteibacter sp. PPL201]|uniref:histidine kinase n=1 Tax=Luteibacter sahnii TaxID=3021977 RepID=A0ABT6BBU9_9GAMM